MLGIRDRSLKNGLRLITIKKPGALMAVNFGIASGAMYDPPELKGISHFMEHMLFTGTTNRTHGAINEEFEALGGDVNAFTDLTATVLSASALDSELPGALAVIADLLRNSIFPEIETERERGVILSEYREGLEDIETITFDRLYAGAFPKDPLRYDVIGTEKTIKGITATDLRSHYQTTVVPQNCVLVIISPRPHREVEALVKGNFTDWQGPAPIKPDFPPMKKRAGESTYRRDNSEMSTVALLYSFPPLDDKTEIAMRILNHKLGDSDNSLLFKEVRLKRGLAYDIYSSLDTTEGVNTLEIYCAMDPENLSEVYTIIRETIAGLADGSLYFPAETLDLMKKVTRTHVANLLDDTQSLAHYVTGNALEGKTLLKYVEDALIMDSITLEDIYAAAAMVFKDPAIHFVIPS